MEALKYYIHRPVNRFRRYIPLLLGVETEALFALLLHYQAKIKTFQY